MATCLFIVVNGFGVFYLYQNYLWLKLQEQQLSEQAINLVLGISHALPNQALTRNDYQQLANRLFNAKSVDAIFFRNDEGEIIAQAGRLDSTPGILANQSNSLVSQIGSDQRLYVSVPVRHGISLNATRSSQDAGVLPGLVVAVSSAALAEHRNQLSWIIAITLGLLAIANLLIILWFRFSQKLSVSIEPAQILQKKFDASHQQLKQSIELQKQAAETTRQEAIKTSELKSQFIANMSHEIRTPLNAIVGFTDLLLRTDLSQRQYNFLSNIKRSSHGLLQIINDILDFSKLEAGKATLELEPVNLRNIIEDALIQLAPAAHVKKLELIPIIYPDTPVHIQADPKRLGQILTNLISNAIKFTHKGSIVVRAKIDKKNTRVPMIKISVSDTGIGISENEQKRLFTAFTQTDTSSTRQYEGTGLGLVIDNQKAEQIHGKIGVESRLNHGSSFRFTIQALPSGEQPEFNEDVFQNRSVFIYDTYPLSRLSLQNTLSQWGIKVSSTNHIEQLEAFVSGNKLPSHLTCVIINLDFSSSKTDAIFHLLRRLKKQYQCPVIVLYNISIDYDETLVQQASLSLAKPVRHEALRKALLHLAKSPETSQEFRIPESRRVFVNHLPRVLAVDDNEANLKLAESLLHEIGAEATCANSGKQALECLAKAPYDAVFMDIQMPEMDGVETTQLIRGRPSAYRDIPIIALTAHALESEKKQWLNCGIDDYLSKPVSEEQLVDALLRWTDAKAEKIQANENIPAPGTVKDVRAGQTKYSSSQDVPHQVVDIEMGVRLAGGKRELAKELFDMLVANLDKDADAIRSASASRSGEKLLRRVHHLHGATRYCGVPALQKAAERLELVIKNKDTGNHQIALEQLLREIVRVQEWTRNNQWSTA